VLFRNSQRSHVPEDLLSAYLDRQVTAVERDRIERHMQACATCQRELETLRQTVALLRAMPRVPVPRAFTLSEVQVGIRRPEARPAWYGGALRGLAAVTAMALVAVVAATLLRQQTWTPGGMVALAPKPAAQATAAPAAEAARSGQVAKRAAAPTQAPAPTAEPAEAAVVVEEAPLADVQPPQAPQPAPQPQPAAKVATDNTTSVTEEPSLMAEPEAMAAMAAPVEQATAAGVTAAPGLGGGGGGGAETGAEGPVAAAAEGLMAAAAPLAAPIASVLPGGVELVYADQNSLWALDSQSGQRQVLQGADISSPLISSDRDWIAYRSQESDHVELWALPWEGREPRMVLDERALPANDLAQGYVERRIQDMLWVPGGHRLAVITQAAPGESEMPPEYELWNVDVESGELTYVTRMGQADRPFYAPAGDRFALLRQDGSDSGLWIFNADGSGARSALDLPAGAGSPVYDWQVHWQPNGDGLWAAVPNPAEGVRIALYRVPVSGQAELLKTIDALDAYWSPDGSRLAYTSPASESPEAREFYLADADGSNPALVATPRYWAFLGWAPDGNHFLYQDNQQIYLGAPGEAAQALGNFLSIFDPRWISSEQFLHFLDQDANWVLVSRWLDGRTASLVSLPRDVRYDVTSR
jgi:anti-sigma factor RsiW